ncbi:MAG: 3-hydroxyacyl-ACP dehydratase FabZ [Rickettsiales bacterium]|jgi:3-hydroxyacyl-[acyl-carrier-protein] dehydratase|nr:3-hydroxyacyl-ACP dehydratase FabZ [Rickettsiales bacterium]
MSSLTKQEIEKIIPHRDNMMLLDAATEITETHGVAIHNVRADEFWCKGHFPGNPVMPGVLQVEALAQTACLVALNDVREKYPNKKGMGYFTTIDKCKFTRMVKPGDVLELEVKQIQKRLMMYKFEGVARVNGETTCTTTLSAILQFN